ncbi:MAG: formate hydrogenase [Leptospiraceae bacterium]|nr:formate hydrogenase [Leptospiraceae bacterium]
MFNSFYDLVYLCILLTGLIILIENRLKRLIFLIAFQGILLVFPIFQVHSIEEIHSWILVTLVLVFKVVLTAYILLWSIKKTRLKEHTEPRFGYLGTTFLFLTGISATYLVVNGIGELPKGIDKIEVVYIFLLIYIGILSFIVRTHWIVLILGFTVFENGIFLLALVLRHGLPFGVELGAFIDTIMIIFSAVVLRHREFTLKNPEEFQ